MWTSRSNLYVFDKDEWWWWCGGQSISSWGEEKFDLMCCCMTRSWWQHARWLMWKEEAYLLSWQYTVLDLLQICDVQEVVGNQRDGWCEKWKHICWVDNIMYWIAFKSMIYKHGTHCYLPWKFLVALGGFQIKIMLSRSMLKNYWRFITMTCDGLFSNISTLVVVYGYGTLHCV